jgi:inositol oxygenase
MLEWVRTFNPYDLYSKSDTRPSLAELKGFYTDLIAEYFPSEIAW